MSHTRTPEDASRAQKAVNLRAQSCTYEQIARACGYSDRSAARRVVQRELARRVATNVDELRHEQQNALDELYRKVAPLVFNEEKKVRLRAVDRLLRILDQEAKLWGLYPPPVCEHAHHNGAVVIVREERARHVQTPEQYHSAYKIDLAVPR